MEDSCIFYSKCYNICKEMMLVDLGLLIKCVRKELGLSQEQLARELNISFSTVNRWENRKTNPSQMAKEIFFKFCDTNNVDIKK